MKRHYFLFIVLLGSSTLSAQQYPLKVWLNEGFPLEYAFLRNETPWIDYVRNRGDADVQVQLTRESLAGSNRIVLYYYGGNRFEGQYDTVFFDGRPLEPFNSYRERLLRAYKRGLLGYLVQLPAAANLTLEPVEHLDFAENTFQDWGKWVCVTSGSGSLRFADYKNNMQRSNGISYTLTPKIALWRVSTVSRIWFNTDYSLSNSSSAITLSEISDTIKTQTKDFDFDAGFARALSKHWSVGIAVNTNTFYSKDYRTGRISGGPLNRERNSRSTIYSVAAEYSIYPYESFFRNRLLLCYQASLPDNSNHIYDNFSRFSHSILIKAAKLTSWGVWSGGAELIHRPKPGVWDDYTFRANGSVLINLRRNLYFQAYIGYTWANRANFSTLAPGVPLPESKNARTLSLYTNSGLIYSFGAEHLNMINPRLGAFQVSGYN